MRHNDIIEVKYNLHIEARERGKLVQSMDTHNIFVDSGRYWLSRLMGYKTLPTPPTAPNEGTTATPVDPYVNHRIRYIGVGIGGDRQHYPVTYFNTPPLDVYQATFLQNDTTPAVSHLETPVPVYEHNGIYWLAQVTNTLTGLPNGQIKFTRVFTENELSFGGRPIIPVSEVALFTNEADPTASPYPTRYDGPMVCYDTLDTLPKNNSIVLQFDWTLRV